MREWQERVNMPAGVCYGVAVGTQHRVQAHIQVNRLFGQLSFTAKSGACGADWCLGLVWLGSNRVTYYVYILDISLLYLRLSAAPCREFVCLTSLWELQKRTREDINKERCETQIRSLLSGRWLIRNQQRRTGFGLAISLEIRLLYAKSYKAKILMKFWCVAQGETFEKHTHTHTLRGGPRNWVSSRVLWKGRACCVPAKWVEISINWRRKLPRKHNG